MASSRNTGSLGTRAALAFALAMGAATGAHAQAPSRMLLEPVDPGHADVGPLGVSTRTIPVDMRSPSGFDRVFRVPGSAAGVGTIDVPNDRFARVSGGIAAVFPRSSYVTGEKGRYALVPAGTVYYIGGINELRVEADAAAAVRPSVRGGQSMMSASMAAPLSVSTRVGEGGVAQAGIGRVDLRVPDANSPEGQHERDRPRLRPDPAPPAMNVLADDRYRRARMRQLLMAAAGEE